jgi:hypothetical protein
MARDAGYPVEVSVMAGKEEQAVTAHDDDNESIVA